MGEHPANAHERFVGDMIACQPSIYAYLMALTADPDWTEDVLQETNLALVRKEADYTPGTNFRAWALSIAHFELLTSRKKRQRSRLVFDDALIQEVAIVGSEFFGEHNPNRAILQRCLSALSKRNQELLRMRYASTSISALAAELKRPVASLTQTLYRIRQSLKECAQRRATEGKA